MRTRIVTVAAALLFSGGVTSVALAVPAHAQASEPCPPAQPPDRPIGRPASPPRQPADRPPEYPPGKCQLRLSRSVVAAGGTLQGAGAGFAPGAPVRVTMAGATLASTTANSAGAFETDLVVPASTEPGTHTVNASGPSGSRGGTQVLSASLVVTPAEGAAGGGAGGRAATGAPGAEGGSDLPRTGSSSPLPLSLAGVSLLAVGTAAVVAARRRSTQGRPPG